MIIDAPPKVRIRVYQGGRLVYTGKVGEEIELETGVYRVCGYDRNRMCLMDKRVVM